MTLFLFTNKFRTLDLQLKQLWKKLSAAQQLNKLIFLLWSFVKTVAIKQPLRRGWNSTNEWSMEKSHSQLLPFPLPRFLEGKSCLKTWKAPPSPRSQGRRPATTVGRSSPRNINVTMTWQWNLKLGTKTKKRIQKKTLSATVQTHCAVLVITRKAADVLIGIQSGQLGIVLVPSSRQDLVGQEQTWYQHVAAWNIQNKFKLSFTYQGNQQNWCIWKMIRIDQDTPSSLFTNTSLH